MAKSGSGGLRGTHTSQSPAEMVALYCWRRSADRGFARSGTSGPHPLAPCNLSCSRCSMHVCEHQMSRSTLHRTEFATKRVRPLESPRARRQRLVPTRCYGSGRRALSNPASLARARARETSDRAAASVVLPDAHQSHPNVKWTTLCTYTNSWVRPKRRRGRGGGG